MIRIGTRGSQLALWQSNFVAHQLRSRGHHVSLTIIQTTGDRIQGQPLPTIGGKGLFTAEIESALLDHSIDLAVHSLKDLPTQLAPAFCLAAIPQRADPRDLLLTPSPADLTPSPTTLATLPHAAIVGTSSPRRQGQLLACRKDLQLQPLRGNIDTRIRKLLQGQAHAIVLAAAGIERLGLTGFHSTHLPPDQMCPAPGQGALAIECRADDAPTREALAFLDHPQTRFCVDVERTVLQQLGGGCSVPVGVYCEPRPLSDGAQAHHCWAVVCAPDGSSILRIQHTLHTHRGDVEAIAGHLTDTLLHQGAHKILNA